MMPASDDHLTPERGILFVTYGLQQPFLQIVSDRKMNEMKAQNTSRFTYNILVRVGDIRCSRSGYKRQQQIK